jgi:hypothetical protein
MTFGPLILKRASASRLSGEWNDDDYDVLADGAVVGRIMKVGTADINRRRALIVFDAIDPYVWSGRAVQEVFVDSG